MKQTTSQSWDWYEKSTQHIYNWLITGPRHFRGTGLLHWIASALPEDRVLPYNGQNMLDTNKTKAFDIITSAYMFQKRISS